VLIALALDETPAKVLAERLHCTPGALYKTLHDARRKLRDGLTSAPADRHDVEPAKTSPRLKMAG